MTILVGANDVCLGLAIAINNNNIESRSDSNRLNWNFKRSCSRDVPTITADDFEKNMRENLEEVCKNILKLFVHLVLGNISEV